MRFGNTAIVRVGRGPAARGPMHGFSPEPTSVRVGRQDYTRVGQATMQGGASAPGIVPPSISPVGGGDFAASAPGPTLWCGAGTTVRQEPLGSTRASVPAGATQEFLFQPCSPFRLHYFTIPESFALLFTVISLKICRLELTEGETPAEAFSNQGGFMNNIVDGRFIYPSIPGRLLVRNDSTAAAFFNALLFGAVQDC